MEDEEKGHRGQSTLFTQIVGSLLERRSNQLLFGSLPKSGVEMKVQIRLKSSLPLENSEWI
jgi:hypothetical protein